MIWSDGQLATLKNGSYFQPVGNRFVFAETREFFTLDKSTRTPADRERNFDPHVHCGRQWLPLDEYYSPFLFSPAYWRRSPQQPILVVPPTMSRCLCTTKPFAPTVPISSWTICWRSSRTVSSPSSISGWYRGVTPGSNRTAHSFARLLHLLQSPSLSSSPVPFGSAFLDVFSSFVSLRKKMASHRLDRDFIEGIQFLSQNWRNSKIWSEKGEGGRSWLAIVKIHEVRKLPRSRIHGITNYLPYFFFSLFWDILIYFS